MMHRDADFKASTVSTEHVHKRHMQPRYNERGENEMTGEAVMHAHPHASERKKNAWPGGRYAK